LDTSAWLPPKYNQKSWRWYENIDAVTPTTAIANEVTAASDIGKLQSIRLRISADTLISQREIGQDNLKLQFAEKAATCAVVVSWSDVGGVSGTSTWNGYDNASVVDAAVIPSTVLTGSTQAQSYEESSPTGDNTQSAAVASVLEWDFALVAKDPTPGTTYCFRLAYDSGDEVSTYGSYPELTVEISELTFSISDNSIGFGSLSSSLSRYASADESGSNSEVAAHSLTVNTNAGNYSVFINGPGFTSSNADQITSLPAVATAPVVGQEQFGLRVGINSGVIVPTAPYGSAGMYAYSENSIDQIASGVGDKTDQILDVYYLSNISALTENGIYETDITYTVTAQF
jgi:hypothetical protein